MSATNRGSKRIKSDFYKTPQKTIEILLKNHKIKGTHILEPCAGDGSIIKPLRQYYNNLHITAIETRTEEEKKLNIISDNVIIDDFLNFYPQNNFDTIITNPPYSIAQEILEHCFKISNKNTEIIVLLRLAFLESKKRFNFWQKYIVNKLYVLSERPSFTGKGTDATAYGWFVFNNSQTQHIKII